NFFPERDQLFELKIPTGEVFSAKVCQDNSKALMTNPNKALSDWLLRKVFQVKEGELLTIEKMNELGFDSVIICKDANGNYQTDKANLDSYEQFIKEQSTSHNKGLAQWRVKAKNEVLAFYFAKSQLY